MAPDTEQQSDRLKAAEAALGDGQLERSRAFCRDLTRTAARNFYYGLKLLSEPRRSAMFALYAYMRLVDDIADDNDGRSVPQRLADLDAWQQQTHAVLNGRPPDADAHAVWPAFFDLVHRYKVPGYVFDAVIAGQQQDLEKVAFDTFEQLSEYCYRVAGVVGLASIYVWGFEGGEATEALAIDRGAAFQLTNILRDLREDAARGRLYLPREELARFELTEDELGIDGPGGEKFDRFMRFQIDRAQAFYDRSAPLESRIDRSSRPTLVAMTQIYHGLLKKISARPRRVLRERVSLSLWSKLRIGWRAMRAG